MTQCGESHTKSGRQVSLKVIISRISRIDGWNVRTVYALEKIGQMVWDIWHTLSILRLGETRWLGAGKIDSKHR